ncbi:hypothetical protein BZG01_06175 [Labilibaculum manganireducens]|uniref:Uncharacterized protein n=1 Tax=Labilibaculum manganireducens TaxID=1940525 RepID=A0A2N3ICE8_9BACT|nr:hypothetical protein BZG01_06175 [Labilibaculum manganireducens]
MQLKLRTYFASSYLQYLPLATCYLPLVTCYLLLVTCYLLLVTCHLQLVTCHLSLVTCHLQLITCYLSLSLRIHHSNGNQIHQFANRTFEGNNMN